MDATRVAQLRYQRLNHGGKMEVVEELGEWLDASKVDLLHLCPQKFYWRHELGLVPIGTEGDFANPMQYGFALHKALESIYNGSGFDGVTCPCPTFEGCDFCQGKSVQGFVAQFLIHYPTDPMDDKDPRTRWRGIEILNEYIHKWRTDQFDAIAVEVPFAIPFYNDECECGHLEKDHSFEEGSKDALCHLCDTIHEFKRKLKFTFIGRIDLVGRDKGTGRIFPNDHKSTTRFGELFDQQFKLSLQMSGYIVALEEITKENVDEAQINAIRVTTKIDDDSFRRLTTTRTPEEKKRWRLEVEEAFQQIKRFRSIDFWPRHAPFACSAYFRKCEYYALCISGAETQKDLIQTSYEVKPWSPVGEP